jgi:hypothetical protein
MDDLTISVSSEGTTLKIDEFVPETSVKDLLTFDSNRLADYYPKHAALQAYWEELANNLKGRYENFKNIDYKKWWSHNRRYARLVLAAVGDKKPLLDSIQDMVISIYSSDASDLQKEKYCDFAHKEANKQKGIFALDKEDFHQEMYKYVLGESPLYFEVMEEALLKMGKDYESVRIIAERLNSRSFHMQEVAKLINQKMSNTELTFRGGDATLNRTEKQANYFNREQ